MFKRLFLLLTVFALLASNIAISTAESVFDPDSIINKYNDSIIPFFSALTGESGSGYTMVKIQLTLNYDGISNGNIVYTNYDSTVKATFQRNALTSKIDKVTFWTSLSDNSDWKNIPQLIFAYTVCLSRYADADFLQWVNDSNDSSTFTNSDFRATKGSIYRQESWITITAR